MPKKTINNGQAPIQGGSRNGPHQAQRNSTHRLHGCVLVLLACILQLGNFEASHAQQLSPQDQAALLQLKISKAADTAGKAATKAQREAEYQRLLSLIEQYRALPVPFVTAYSYVEALAAYNTGNQALALAAASSYLKAPDGQQFHDEALHLVLKIQEENEAKSTSEMKITWVSEQGAIRSGQATVQGRLVRIRGLTLSCELWTPAVSDGWKIFSDPQVSESALGYGEGQDRARRYWTRVKPVWTFHWIDPTSSDPGDAYHRAPWEGYYNHGIRHWFTYAERPHQHLVLWDKTVRLGNQRLVYYGEHAQHDIFDGNPFSAKERFEIDLAAFEVHQIIDPYFEPTYDDGGAAFCVHRQADSPSSGAKERCDRFVRGFRAITDAQAPVCHLVAYQPPAMNPPLSGEP